MTACRSSNPQKENSPLIAGLVWHVDDFHLDTEFGADHSSDNVTGVWFNVVVLHFDCVGWSPAALSP